MHVLSLDLKNEVDPSHNPREVYPTYAGLLFKSGFARSPLGTKSRFGTPVAQKLEREKTREGASRVYVRRSNRSRARPPCTCDRQEYLHRFCERTRG